MSSPDLPGGDFSEAIEEPKIPLVVVLGPTAVGKTEIAIQLAEKLDGEIVSADSRLFYRGMDIGTAKPTIQERARIPHHLIDVADPDEIWSLALFQLEANKAIHNIYIQHNLPIMVGGTGQFVRAVIEGWKVPTVVPDPLLRKVLTDWSKHVGPAVLHSKLAILDPVAANSIDLTNVRRTIRALEVILSSGKRFSDQREKGHQLYRSLQLGLTRPRTELYQRIDNRIMEMFAAGFIGEVQRLLERGFSPDSPTLSAIGYGEVIAYLQGKITLDEAIVIIKRRTRIYVRRQANWFKTDDPDIHWFQVNTHTVEDMRKMVDDWFISPVS